MPWLVNYGQLAGNRPPFVHEKMVAYGQNQQTKPKLDDDLL